jgi:hypothetical protein
MQESYWIDKLSSFIWFFMMIAVHSNVKGIVYYTSTLNKTLNKYANISDRCQYIKLLMI